MTNEGFFYCCVVLFCSLAVLDPKVGHLSLSSVILVDSSIESPVHVVYYRDTVLMQDMPSFTDAKAVRTLKFVNKTVCTSTSCVSDNRVTAA